MRDNQPIKRSYVACISCRSKKVKCILGNEPPCARCQREHRDCVFGLPPRSKSGKKRNPPRWVVSEADDAPAPASVPASTSIPASAVPANSSDDHQFPDSSREKSPDSASLLSDRVVSAIVTGPNDALDVLSTAAISAASQPSAQPSPLSPGLGPSVRPSQPAVGVGGGNGLGFIIESLSEPQDAILDLWDRCRFVRQGWFTAQEAVTYVDLFFEHLSPLSPVVLDQFCPHSGHSKLVCEEAMLCCAILTISSRFFMLPGPGGASRSHSVHHRLWHYTELLLKRLILGQEKHSTAKIRTVGTIESLILLSDWHPRAVHLPPETEGWDDLLISPDYDRQNRKRTNNEDPLIRWREDVFEPAKRASRMTWMLLGIASNLAYETGLLSSGGPESVDPADDEARRKYRARKLLYIYITQTATRLNYPSNLPDEVVINATRSTMPSAGDPQQESWAAYIDASTELARLSRTANSMFFQSSDHLKSQLRNNQYLDVLEHLSTSFENWKSSLDKNMQIVPEPLRHSLLVEYYHLKAYVSAISIQAIVERASTASKPPPPSSDHPGVAATTTNTTGNGAPSTRASTINYASIAEYVTPRNSRFLQEVVTSATQVLYLATDPSSSLCRSRQLPYAPARLRITVISASVLLLKAISLPPWCNITDRTRRGAVLDALDRCIAALREYSPDDLDFAMRYAMLLEKQISRFRGGGAGGDGGGGGAHMTPTTATTATTTTAGRLYHHSPPPDRQNSGTDWRVVDSSGYENSNHDGQQLRGFADDDNGIICDAVSSGVVPPAQHQQQQQQAAEAETSFGYHQHEPFNAALPGRGNGGFENSPPPPLITTNREPDEVVVGGCWASSSDAVDMGMLLCGGGGVYSSSSSCGDQLSLGLDVDSLSFLWSSGGGV